MPQKPTYHPEIFDVAELHDARRIILTPEGGLTTDERWESETPYLAGLIAENLKLSTRSVVVDYGCGVGRLARELISRCGCRVVGVDISAAMRSLAERYVGSDRFSTCAPEGLDVFGEAFADAALAVWVLQHCPGVDQDLERIRRSLKIDGQLFVVNENRRCLPTTHGWMSDGLDLPRILLSRFDLDARGHLDPEVMTQARSETTFWALYRAGRTGAAATAPLPVDAVGTNPPGSSEVGTPPSILATAPTQEPNQTSSASVQDSFPLATVRVAYPALSAVPTQSGAKGIRFDFNDGCRITLPEGEHPWHVRLSDLDTGNILFETEFKSGRVSSTKRYFVRFRIEVWQQGESIFRHDYCAADRDVLIRFPVDTLGDPLGWFPYAVKFNESHGCRLTCAIGGKLIPLLRDAYPGITFVTEDDVDPERYYATYTIAVFFQNGAIFDHKDFVPCDFRLVGLHRAAGYILGVDPAEVPPRIAISDDRRPLEQPYVCIAVQSTLQSKYWNNPTGWDEIVGFLKHAGYRVVCIDQKRTHGKGLVWTHMPNGAEDETGDRPLAERARWLKHADFFVGLSSGLSWLAWAVGTPVVMISGVTHPRTEFVTPFRVVNYHVCNSCWNDPLVRYMREDFLTCPRHKDTPRQFECTRLITAEHVKAVIRTIPRFGSPRCLSGE
jgi:autotransporter strand-loop-strand O-heptosyltransferase